MIALEPLPTADRPRVIAEAATRLRAAGSDLRARSPAEVLDSVCAVLDLWQSPSSRWRQRLEAELPAATGFAPEAVHEGLRLAFEQWTGSALRALAERELGPAGLGSASYATGFDLTSVLLAGAIPMPTLSSLLLPLVLRSPVLAKAASRDLVTPALVQGSVAEVDPELAGCLEVVSFPSPDQAAAHAFLAGDCVVATGSDTTVAEVSHRLRASKRLVRYGHRLSVALLGPEASSGAALLDVAERLAIDIALWDQLGCLSPAALFVCDPDPEAGRTVAAAVAGALASLEARWPRGPVSRETAAAIRRERGEAEMRASELPGVEVHSSEGTRWTVIAEADASWRPTPLHRFLRVHPIRWPRQSPERGPVVADALRPIAPHLSSVAMEGFGGADAEMATELAALGASRICRPGRSQAPPIDWHHDGMPVLLPLARVCDLELATTRA